jgi:uncharacterized protein (UPF0212 family)
MKIILEMEIKEEDLKEWAKNISKKEVKEELTQMLFEVCEEWVLRGTIPDLEFRS